MSEESVVAQLAAIWEMNKGKTATVYWGEGHGVRAVVKIYGTETDATGEVRLIGWWSSQKTVLNIPASQVKVIRLGGVETEEAQPTDDSSIEKE